MLVATSIVNVGDSGIAFFYLLLLIPLLAFIFPNRWFFADPGDANSLGIAILVIIAAAALIGTTFLQLFTINVVEPKGEFVHLVSRLSFLAYFAVAQRYVRGEFAVNTMVWLRRLLLVVCAYGIYQVPANLLGLPLFLDWLRNNKSFLMYSYDASSWVGLIRANSIFAEPSQATVPIIVLFMLNLLVGGTTASKICSWAVLMGFVVATFSRTGWVALLALVGALMLTRSQRVQQVFRTKRTGLMAATFVAFLVLPLWGVIGANDNSDLSAQERSASIVLGLHMIKTSPILGYGWNSFPDVAARHTDIPLAVDPEIEFNFVHNMVISYIQQTGIAGLLLAFLPFILIIRWSTAPAWMNCATLASFLVTAELSDIGYTPLTWLWMALLINMNTAPELLPLKPTELSARRPVYRAQMSVSPPSPN